MRRGAAFCTGYRAGLSNGVPAGAKRHHIRLVPAERGYSLPAVEAANDTGDREHSSLCADWAEPGEITEQSLMREVCGKPGVVRSLRKSFDTKELFGALQKVCGFENNRVDG